MHWRAMRAQATPASQNKPAEIRVSRQIADVLLDKRRVDHDLLAGAVSLRDLLRARTRNLEEERARELVLRLWTPFGRPAKERTIPLTHDTDFQDESKPIERR